MIHDQITGLIGTTSSPNDPFKTRSAPVAGVGSFPDRLIENVAVDENFSGRASEWVADIGTCHTLAGVGHVTGASL
jgi:hypothetical protein